MRTGEEREALFGSRIESEPVRGLAQNPPKRGEQLLSAAPSSGSDEHARGDALVASVLSKHRREHLRVEVKRRTRPVSGDDAHRRDIAPLCCFCVLVWG